MYIWTNKNRWARLSLLTWWQYRHVLVSLVRRDIAIHYKQTCLGFFWVLGKATIEVVVFTFLFSKHLKIDVGSVPYPLFVTLGVLTWSFTSSALSSATTSMLQGRLFLQKLYFPRILIPIASIFSRGIDLAASLLLFIVLLLFYGVMPPVSAINALPLLFLLLLCVIGISAITASLHLQYRDIGLLVPYVLRIGLFLSPVVYAVETIDPVYRWFFYLNPIAGIIETLRAVFFVESVSIDLLLSSIVLSLLLFVAGILFFQWREPRVLDLL